MKNILSMTMLLLGNQIAFGMDTNGTVKTINHPEVCTIEYVESSNCKSYHATLNNGDIIHADFFVAGPTKGLYYCTRTIYLPDTDEQKILIDNNAYYVLRNLYEAQKD